MKKKIWFIALATMLLAVVIVGGTWASLNTTTENGAGTGIAQITTKSLSVQGAETVKTESVLKEGNTPGGNYACPFQVKNDAQTDAYSLYAKVTIYKYWKDSATNQNTDISADMAGFAIADGTGEYCVIDPEKTAPQVKTSGTAPYKVNDWIVAYEDEEQMVMYYTKPLAKGECSQNCLDAIVFDKAMNNSYTDKELSLEFEVNAVQANSSEDAMQAEWGVYPLIGSDGTIVNVFETRAERDALK